MSAGGELFSFLTARPVLTASVVTACAAAVGLWLFFRRQCSSRIVATVTGLFIYPVKSCQGISVTTAQCGARGFRYDRRWVVVDRWSKNTPPGTAGCYLSVHQNPKLAQIKPSVDIDEGDGSVILRLNAPDMRELVVQNSQDSSASGLVRVSIHEIEGEAIDCGDTAAAWLVEYTNLPGVRLYYMSDDMKARKLADDQTWGASLGDEQKEVAFASFSPYLMANEKSLEDLNSHLPEQICMRRFRANIIVDSCNGQKAFSEDNWRNFRIGDVPFRFLKKCGRCAVTTLDPDTARRVSPEPIKTLRQYRVDTSDERYGTSPCFGVNIESLEEGTISVGDKLVLCSQNS